MKKILTLALTAALLLSSVSMFACSSDSADNTTTTTAGTTTAATTTAATTAGSTTTNPTETSGSATTGGEDAELYYWFDLNRDDETEYIDTTEMRANYVNLTVDHNATISSKSNFVGFDYTGVEGDDAALGNEGPQQLFDDDSTTKYCGSAANCEDKYVIFTTDQAVTVKAYIYTTANDNATYTERNLEAWALLATNAELGDDWELTEDNYTDWTVLDIVYYCNLPDENYTECGFEIDEENQGAYNTYMFYVLWGETQSGVLQVADITILGTD